MASELDHPPIGLGAEQQMLNVEMLVGFVGKAKFARSVYKRWNAHGPALMLALVQPLNTMGSTSIPVWMRACSTSFRKGSSGGVPQALRKSS